MNDASRASIAQMNDSEKIAAAELVGSYMLQGKTQDEATRLMINDYTQQNANFRSQVQASAKTGADAPTAPPAGPTAPPVSTTINLTVPGGGTQQLVIQPIKQKDGTVLYAAVPVGGNSGQGANAHNVNTPKTPAPPPGSAGWDQNDVDAISKYAMKGGKDWQAKINASNRVKDKAGLIRAVQNVLSMKGGGFGQ
jgi:hypothetical protein